MATNPHIYNITVSTGGSLTMYESKGQLEVKYSGIATTYIPVENEKGQTVELMKFQIVKAELINVEE